jgi:hypothetical protein
MVFCPAVNTVASSLCSSANQYTLAGDTVCRTCPANAAAVPTKDGCMCKDGYVPKPTTSSLDGSLECVACAAGTYARAGNQNCTKCPQNAISGAAAGACITCQTSRLSSFDDTVAENVANAAQTDCVCVMPSPRPGIICFTEGSGALARCSCNLTEQTGGICFSPFEPRTCLLCVLH